ncbi:MAG TPA: MerR family transcriptional regulator [Candidatus Limnocylindria bacterium]|nr:MerR family transcriptional regulator [Candidatus Limnocylindria bacterium]
MRVSDLVERSGLPARTVRYYADRRLIRAVRRSASGQRVFDETALRQLRFVRRMQHLGLALREIEQLLRATEGLSCRPSSQVITARLQRHVATVDARLQELEAVRHELATLLTANEAGCSDELCLCASTRDAGPRSRRRE